ncbi:MAG: Enolase [Candidatus Gottesmanbacteria bacterium GW2011_GWC2_39_8]|uniref:Enolase n=1 Tax=Candidatus Gottesmanbacteria bacterium GW2011_GWC2_39_8 TaxID=1618450 RepID=A0A0G0Q1V2_9BACT|nr:MAG: Enolase [Candidatus Gottesmanbacteria bacterium GW2011_GWC2_39_8]
MAKIKEIHAREILDSRGSPTVETKITLDNGIFGITSVPSGASLGRYEALELRDRDPNRYHGLGVMKAVENVNHIIAPRLNGADPVKQFDLDQFLVNLDGTPNKTKLGANAILSVSMGIARVAALAQNIPLYKHINNLDNTIEVPHTYDKIPTPTFNIINGGKHGAGNLDFQEFHVIPASNKAYHDALRMGEEIYQALKDVLTYRNAIHSIGDEGGFAPNLFTNADALYSL